MKFKIPVYTDAKETWHSEVVGTMIYQIASFSLCFSWLETKEVVWFFLIIRKSSDKWSRCMAGLAFHPVDGILQAIPHLFALFLIPTHFRTHIVLLFLEVVWTANIHDCVHAQMWPVMGAGYHTIHHTRYRYNYGHYTVWMDWMFGTLIDPMDSAKGSWSVASISTANSI